MAIITDIIDERGHIYEQQYVRPELVHTYKDKMNIEVGIHESEESARENIPPHRVEVLWQQPFDMFSDLNIWQQAYEYIKNNYPEHVDV